MTTTRRPTVEQRLADAAYRMEAEFSAHVARRLAILDEMLAATQSLMDANQAASDATMRAVFELAEKVELIEEWVRVRFEQQREQ